MSILNEISKLKESNFCKDNMNLPMFPEPINGEISSKDFLSASRGVVRILDYFGKIFMTVKYDLQENIDKLAKTFNFNRKTHSTLQKMMIEEKTEMENQIAIEALLWLGRGLQMIQIFFECIINDFESGKGSEDLVVCFIKSYELTLEPYHGYISHQLYGLLSRMMPTRTQILEAIANGYDVKHEIVIKSIDKFSKRLKVNLVLLKALYEEHNVDINFIL